MIIGYARVSTTDQNLDLQLDSLEKYGCERIYQENISTRKKDRPEMQKCLDSLRTGDTLVVWRFDRLERGLKELVNLADDFKNRGINLVSITQNIDTSTANGKLQFNMFAMLAEHERDLIRERTLAGLESARQRGKMGGRKFAVSDNDQRKIKILMSDPSTSATALAKEYGISRATLYKIVNGTYSLGRKGKDTAITAPAVTPVEPKTKTATKAPKTKKTAKNAPAVAPDTMLFDDDSNGLANDWRLHGLNDEQLSKLKYNIYDFGDNNLEQFTPVMEKNGFNYLQAFELIKNRLKNPKFAIKFHAIDEILAK